MNFYLKLLIKILERSMTAKDSEILKKIKIRLWFIKWRKERTRRAYR